MNSKIVTYPNIGNERLQVFQTVVNNTDIMPQKNQEKGYIKTFLP